MIIFRLLLLLIVWEVEQSYGNEIIPTSQSVLTPGIAVRELQNAFDNNRETQTLLHSDTHQKVSILISLSVEYQIENIEIISDVPSELHQTVYVGFAQDASTPDLLSLPYECLPNKTSTVCRPFCAESSHGNREGVAGTTVIWTLERTGEKGWSRIYDVILRGRPLEDLLVIQDKVADITLLKPYSVESSGERESCEKPVWKLIDTSTADANMEPVSQTSQNVTIYFGRTYAVTKVALIVSKQNEGVFETESPVLYFGGLKPFEKMLNLGSDCSLHDETLGLRVCLTPELSNYPFSNLTLNVKGLVRLHVFGMPFYYPRLALVTSTKTADPEANKEIQFKCVAISCGPNLFTHLESLVHRLPANSCTRHGRIVNCVNMQLVRLHQTTPELEDGPVPDTVLVTDGHVVPEVEKIMTGLKVQESSDSDLIVNIPRSKFTICRLQY
ncbi:hypothetical protein EG68_00746 [Paragonimus skrjabini miyazakii]|uniref:Uncharacterized protein n=1 Tax=Paragonimus skrjabini miyazakii TaxID=59628 RepID=A0A8S9Z3J5_9TREM|nr:hypothetical protein EG68_00746 [Paragonimus skrjabini miyazakii]